jgi:hypothetical protein
MNKLVLLLVLATATAPAMAEDPARTLARELTNPFADVLNVPINQNPDFGFGDGGWRYTLTLQPVIPFALSPEWNIISRSVIPVIYRDTGGNSDFGLGDTTQSFFLSPTDSGENGWFWGVGPAFHIPTATEASLGTNQWGVGPTVGLLKRSDPWTVGALTWHIWSLSSSKISQTYLQPFIDYTTKSETTFEVKVEATYDWTDDQWTVPINFVVRQLFDIGHGKYMTIAFGPRYYAVTPEGGPQWGLRLGITLVFPK